MATAKKLPSGAYRCLIFDRMENGKRKYRSFTAPTKKEAEYKAAQYIMEKEEKENSGRNNNLFKDELEKYITAKEAVLSPSTIRGYRNIQKALEKRYVDFCSMKLSDISQENVQSVISDLSKIRAPKTVRNYHGLISSVLGTDLVLSTTLPQKVQPDLYIPSDEEIHALVKAVKDTELEIPVLLGAFCMMRRGEICGLSMTDIKGSTIHIHHSLVCGADKKWHLKAPKTETSDRYIEAPEFVVSRIREAGRITSLNPHSITIMFNRVLDRNGINHFRFHDLRHYSASIRHALGIPDAYIMADGGWRSDKVLKSVYRHAMDDRKKEMSDKANSHFSQLCNTKCNTKK
ncbi:MAG: site-specific integrase [Lachnospiraceae bacterium]|nr:site-specific integrase [Lachnospiraceae bacterium]